MTYPSEVCMWDMSGEKSIDIAVVAQFYGRTIVD